MQESPSSDEEDSLQYSVAVIARNEGPNIAKCVKSILRQSLQPHNVVVVNDGSGDDTGRVLAGIQGITVLTNEPHESYLASPQLAAVRNSAIAEAVSGDTKYVLCVDGDTVLSSNYAGSLIGRMGGSRIVIASGVMGSDLRMTPRESGRMIYWPWFSQVGGYPVEWGHDTYPLVQAVLDGYQFAIYRDIPMEHLRQLGDRYDAERWYNLGLARRALGMYLALSTFRAARQTPRGVLPCMRGWLAGSEKYGPAVGEWIRKFQRESVYRKLRLKKPTLCNQVGPAIITG